MLEWKMVSIAHERQLEDCDRIAKKHKKIKQYAREAARTMDMSACEGDINTLKETISGLQERKRELEQKVQEFQDKLQMQEANWRAEEATRAVPPHGIQLSEVSMNTGILNNYHCLEC
jgi:predicted  nucleic acid-binding Zn-ribbon protein